MKKHFSLNRVISKTKKYIFGDLLGNNSSKTIGDGYDFAQISQYQYGDNIRRVDPYSSAKKNELHVREFYEAKEINLHVILCASGSLHFGSIRLKQDVIAEAISLLGFSAVKNAESFSFSMLSDKLEYQSFLKKSKNAVIKCAEEVLKADMRGKKLDYKFINSYLLKQKRSIVFLIGDFFEIPKIKSASKKHQIVALKIRDIFEEEPKAIGEIDILNPSNMQNIEVLFDKKGVKEYVKRIKEHDMKLGEYFKSIGIKCIDVYTHDNVYQKIEKAFRGL